MVSLSKKSRGFSSPTGCQIHYYESNLKILITSRCVVMSHGTVNDGGKLMLACLCAVMQQRTYIHRRLRDTPSPRYWNGKAIAIICATWLLSVQRKWRKHVYAYAVHMTSLVWRQAGQCEFRIVYLCGRLNSVHRVKSTRPSSSQDWNMRRARPQ